MSYNVGFGNSYSDPEGISPDRNIVTVDSEYVADFGDYIYASSGSRQFTIILPKADKDDAGKVVTIKDKFNSFDTNPVTLTTLDNSDINGFKTIILNVEGTTIDLFWSGSEWVQNGGNVDIEDSITKPTNPITDSNDHNPHIGFFAKSTGKYRTIEIPEGEVGLVVDKLVIDNGSKVIIPNDSKIKVV